jgi:hypothetical protein
VVKERVTLLRSRLLRVRRAGSIVCVVVCEYAGGWLRGARQSVEVLECQDSG